MSHEDQKWQVSCRQTTLMYFPLLCELLVSSLEALSLVNKTLMLGEAL